MTNEHNLATRLMDERANLLAALKTLKNTRLFNFVSVDPALLENEQAVHEYFDAPFDSVTDKNFEKKAAAAATRSVYESKFVPQKLKETWARRQARAVTEALRYAKLNYRHNTQNELLQISSQEYERRMKENTVAQKAAMAERVKNFVIMSAVKVPVAKGLAMLASAVGMTAGAPALVVGLAAFGLVTAAEALIPQEVKARIKDGVYYTANKCVDMAGRAAKRLQEAGQAVARRVEPALTKAKETMARAGQAVRSGWQKTKEAGKRLWNRLFG